MGVALLEMLLEMTLLIYTAQNTLSSSGSGISSNAVSDKDPMGCSGNASHCSGFLLIQLYYCDVLLIANVVCCFVL